MAMTYILYAPQSKKSIESTLGVADYSYYYVLNYYRPVLEKLGEVVIVDRPESEVDAIYNAEKEKGREAVFLSFAPPHKTALGLQCPTIPVFAWEYVTIPAEVFAGDNRNDWRTVFAQTGRAITHSEFAARAVQQVMPPDFEIISVPAPVWDEYAVHRRSARPDLNRGADLLINGFVVDSREVQNEHNWIDTAKLPSFETADYISLRLSGVVYTAIFNPNDGRKNWLDLVWAFVWALRTVEDATLVLKLTYHHARWAFELVLPELNKLSPFRCRIVVIHGYLDGDGYADLLKASHYIVNSAHGEGQCLPLMEFMSAGVPAIAPNHTAMQEYVTENNSFVVQSSVEWIHWPHDPRAALRTLRYRINWETLFEAYKESYRVIKEKPGRYMRMSRSATKALKAYCSRQAAMRKLEVFIKGKPTSRGPLQELGLRMKSWLHIRRGGSGLGEDRPSESKKSDREVTGSNRKIFEKSRM